MWRIPAAIFLINISWSDLMFTSCLIYVIHFASSEDINMNYVFLSLDIAIARRFSLHFIILGYIILFSVNFQWYAFFCVSQESKQFYLFSSKHFPNFHSHQIICIVFLSSFYLFRIPKDMILYQFDQRKFYLIAKYFHHQQVSHIYLFTTKQF